MLPNSYIKDLEKFYELDTNTGYEADRIYNVLERVISEIVDGDELDVPRKLIEMFDKTARSATRVWGPSEKFQLVRSTMNRFFSYVGSGSNVETFWLGTKILKLNCAAGGIANDASCEWIKSCIDIRGNRFVPKFYAMHQIGDMWCALGECLESNDVYEAPDQYALEGLANLNTASSVYDSYEEFVAEVQGEAITAFLAIGREETIQMAKTLTDVRREIKADDDLACFNVMLRGKVPVINDPLAGGIKQYNQTYVYEWVDR